MTKRRRFLAGFATAEVSRRGFVTVPHPDKIRVYRSLEEWCRQRAASVSTFEERQALEEVALEMQIEADWLESDQDENRQ
jgi:hypothetical protein